MALHTRPIREVIEESQSDLMTKADGRDILAEMREMFAGLSSQIAQSDTSITGLGANLDARLTEMDAKSAARDAESDAKADERQTQLYRFILLVGAAATTIISLVAAFT